MITTVKWIPVGAPKKVPKVEDDVEEMDDGADQPTNGQVTTDAQMEHVEADNVEDEEEAVQEEGEGDGLEVMDEDDDGDDDPLMHLGDDLVFRGDEVDPDVDINVESLSDEDDVILQDGDQLIVVGRAEDEGASLDVYLYNDELGQLYTHHDIVLPDVPLCVEWLGVDCITGTKGSWAAVGTMSSDIELWDLDVLDARNPPRVLKGEGKEDEELMMHMQQQQQQQQKGKQKKKGGKKSKKKGSNKMAVEEEGSFEGKVATLHSNDNNNNNNNPNGGHRGAVLSLSWNALQQNILASGGADGCVRLWDLPSQQCNAVYRGAHNGREVQSVRWNPTESTLLASGGFDGSLQIRDVRMSSSSSGGAIQMKLQGECECIHWIKSSSSSSSSKLIVSTDSGHVQLWDFQKSRDRPIWTLHAHDRAATGVACSPLLPGLMLTCSLDSSLKLWDIGNDKPALLATKKGVFGPGALFGVSISEHTPYVCVIAAEGQELNVFDFKSEIPGFVQKLEQNK